VKITEQMKVFEVLARYPDTSAVFQKRGCPDMRAGFFRFMSRLMSVRRAAWVHRIPLDELLRELNQGRA
jgi:hypothetical protein